MRWDAADPPAAFFDLATKAGVATTGEIMSTLGMAIRNCHRAALQGRTEFAATETPMSKIECQAFTREGRHRGFGLGEIDQALPINMPVASTRPPPSMTFAAAETGGVSM